VCSFVQIVLAERAWFLGTQLLDAAAAGDRQAAADLLSLACNELRTFAAARVAVEVPGDGVTCWREIRENVIF
jgi:hypothetical protein